MKLSIILMVFSLGAFTSLHASWYVDASAAAAHLGGSSRWGPYHTKAEAQAACDADPGYGLSVISGGSDDVSAVSPSSGDPLVNAGHNIGTALGQAMVQSMQQAAIEVARRNQEIQAYNARMTEQAAADRSALDKKTKDQEAEENRKDALRDASALDNLQGVLKLSDSDDSSSGLKDAVADNSGSKKLFTTKKAIEDALTASHYGEVGINQIARYSSDAGFNPALEDALTSAKAETNKKFIERGSDVGHFDTIVLPSDSDTPMQLSAQPIPVPDAPKNDPRFQKLVIERDALQHQNQAIGEKIQIIKADPAYTQDSHKLIKLDELQSAQNGVSGMEGYLNNVTKDVIKGTITIGSVDFGDSSPTPKKGLDSIVVPPPSP